MDTSITRLDRIKAEARQAAAKFSTVLEACPYPFGSGAANEFIREFEHARQQQLDELMECDADESPTCACTDQHTVEELDWNKCGNCGKSINP
jgi:hypothetical protein